ncbi:MAG: hypothetical protein HN368_11265 [Spirochaetales bacterium]|nr:hypothetical protein [Spirochaetales bacterium]
MNRLHKITGIIGMLLLIGGFSVFGSVQATESDLVVSDDFAVSYEIQPTDEILTFLADYGISINGIPREVSMDIDGLRSVDFDTDDAYAYNDSWDTTKDALNYLVNSELFEAQREGYEAVYMELGNTRWIMYPSVEE